MPSSVWSGHLTFGLISMPVRLFSGARSSGISFNMLHRTDKSRLKQQYICQAEGVVVDRSDMVKGYEYRKDEYIVIEPDEIKKIEPQTAKTIGDTLSAKGISWAWYAGGWTQALADGRISAGQAAEAARAAHGAVRPATGRRQQPARRPQE